jgi:hypothetical protein
MDLLIRSNRWAYYVLLGPTRVIISNFYSNAVVLAPAGRWQGVQAQLKKRTRAIYTFLKDRTI